MMTATSGAPASGVCMHVPLTPLHEHTAPAPASRICVPCGRGVHMPARPGSTQLWHAPSHAMLQHTPPEHVPMLHSALVAHGDPRLPLGTQRPIWQR